MVPRSHDLTGTVSPQLIMNEEFDVEDDIEDDIDCLWPQLLQEASQKEDNSSSPNELLIEASQKFDINV